MKALILAAGRGSRLSPLTNSIPKPLIKIGTQSIIEKTLLSLKKASVEDIIINVSYLRQKIMKFLGNGSRYGVKISYSNEGDEALETLGGIANALPLFKNDEHIIIVNADILTNYDFSVIKRPERLAHLVLIPAVDNKLGDFSLKREIVSNESERTLIFSGISCFKTKAFKKIKIEKRPLGPYLKLLAERKLLTGELYNGLWEDLGTHESLKRAIKRMSTNSTL